MEKLHNLIDCLFFCLLKGDERGRTSNLSLFTLTLWGSFEAPKETAEGAWGGSTQLGALLSFELLVFDLYFLPF